jgi:2-polyprenyl-3-methyl-5-hydroxy-6-metoxy-1,4-benzoquinol methylase
MPSFPFTNNRIDYLLNLVSPLKKDKILNVGISNIPEIEIKLENRIKEGTTIDLDEEKLLKAKKYLKKTKLVHGDILKYKLKNNYFDKVIMLEVLEHLEYDKLALNRIRLCMKRGGSLIVSVPSNSIWHLINPVKYFEHKRHYSRTEIVNLLQNSGFNIVHVNLVENWKLLANLYVHLFFKYVLKKNVSFNIFDKKGNKTYLKNNNSGLDIIVLAKKR